MKKSSKKKQKFPTKKVKPKPADKNKSKKVSNKDSSNKKEAVSGKHPKWFYFIPFIIPILFFILLESALQVFNYGYNLSQWSELADSKLVLNDDIGKRYFYTTDFKPKTSDNSFDKTKSYNSFRVFVLGGSSAAGFPFMPLGSFSSYVKRRLELNYPDTKIEMINIAMTAVNSYTILDLIPGVIDQDPDLILIYAGHNEYYGAFGVGSVESIGSSRTLKKIVLFLNKFKLTQLVKDVLGIILSPFSEDKNIKDDATLMSRMAENKSIKFKSDIFYAGIEQFTDNLDEILEKITDAKIPVIIGRLVSNYKDQKPFISIETEGEGTASLVFAQARNELGKSNIQLADSLFRKAKDLDALRFRAPEIINTRIEELALKYKIPYAAVDSILNSYSPDGITGNNFMVDHLHPNVAGFQLIGKAYYEQMHRNNFLPKNTQPKIPFENQDSVTLENYYFTELDSSIGNGIVKILKNDWPFVEKKNNAPKSVILNPQNYIDSISLQYIEYKISYIDAYFEIATSYLRKDNLKSYTEYLNTLIYRYPGLKDINTAVKYFYNKGKVNPKDYTSKRLGVISVLNNNYDEAIGYLTESYKLDPKDTEVLYYLALSYENKNDIKSADRYIEECLKIDPANKECLSILEKRNE